MSTPFYGLHFVYANAVMLIREGRIMTQVETDIHAEREMPKWMQASWIFYLIILICSL
jgi:hypothetical protein